MFPKASVLYCVWGLVFIFGSFGAYAQARDAQMIRVKARIIEESYCRADNDLFTVSVELALEVSNLSKEPLDIEKTMIPWVAKVASSLTDAQSGHFIFQLTQSHYPQGDKTSESIRIPPGNSITLSTGYDFVARYNPAFSYPKSLAPGEYGIVLALKPEFESPGQSENSHVIETLDTEPFLLEVKANPKVENCGSTDLRQERLRDQRTNLCYAFLRSGDLWTVCEGKRQRIDLHGRGLDFAVSADGSRVAVQENLEAPGAGIGRTRQRVVPLNQKGKETVRDIAYPESLYASCGTIVSFQPVNFHSFDLVGGKAFEVSPYRYFRCSSDQKVSVGWTEQDDAQRLQRAQADPSVSNQTTLRVNRDGKHTELASVWREVFDISPNGEYLTYVNVPASGPGPALCVARTVAEPACIVHAADAVSVSNEGNVIFWAGGTGVMYWRPGLKRPTALEKTMTNPHAQWITPGIAKALHAWTSAAHAL